MRLITVMLGLSAALLLAACSDDNSADKVGADSHLLDGQVKAMEKARQVEGDIDAAMKKRDADMNH